MEPGKILEKAITGGFTLDIRRRLSLGETINIRNHGDGSDMAISVIGSTAVIKCNGDLLASRDFIEWSDIDSEYQSMLHDFALNSGIYDADFERISSKYHDRF